MPSEKKALLDLTSTAEHELLPVRLVAHETISELFRFDIEAVATGTIDARAMLNKPACLAVNHGDKETRYFHGIVAEFGPIETSGVIDTLYRVVLVPQLAQANIRSDCRLFFNKTAEDILKTIFNDAGVTKIAFRLYSQPAPRKPQRHRASTYQSKRIPIHHSPKRARQARSIPIAPASQPAHFS